MTDSTTRPPADLATRWAGIALIAVPIIAVAVKLAWPGWLLVIILFVSPALLLGYALQVVVAATGFLSRRAVLRTSPARRRALIAAWLSAVGFLVGAFFLVDGGDQDWGSPFMYVIGSASDDAVADVSSAISTVAGVAWLGGWLWLVIEWIAALVRRRAAQRSPAALHERPHP